MGKLKIEEHLKNDRSLPAAAKLYYAKLQEIADKNGVIELSSRDLCKIENVTAATILNWNKKLEKSGYLVRETIIHNSGALCKYRLILTKKN